MGRADALGAGRTLAPRRELGTKQPDQVGEQLTDRQALGERRRRHSRLCYGIRNFGNRSTWEVVSVVQGEQISNPRTGQRMTFVEMSEDLLRIETVHPPSEDREPLHVHPRQESGAEVLS